MQNPRVRGYVRSPANPKDEIVDGALQRGQSSRRVSDFTRESHGTTQPLYDPRKDAMRTNEHAGDVPYVFAQNCVQPPTHSVSSTREASPFDERVYHSGSGLVNNRPSGYESKELSLKNQERTLEHRGTLWDEEEPLAHEPVLLLNAETRPISHEQLVMEVRGIYAGLVMVESKCIDIDERQSAAAQQKDVSKKVHLKNDEWQTLLALHQKLLHEHDELILAGQQSSATLKLRKLLAADIMSSSNWKNRNSPFFKWLRSQASRSSDKLLAFLHKFYSVMDLLCEKNAQFQDAWLETLDDLEAIRKASGERNPNIRRTLTRYWHERVAKEYPNVRELLQSWLGSSNPLNCMPCLETEADTLPNVKEPSYSLQEPPSTKRAQFAIYPFTEVDSFEVANNAFAFSPGQLFRELFVYHKKDEVMWNNHIASSILRFSPVSPEYSPSQNTLKQAARTRKCLPIIIKGREMKAQHDTGAESGNYIACDLANELRLQLRTEKRDRKYFSMGNGKVVQAMGRVKALCTFAKECQTKLKCWFFVFRKLASPLIMGSDFLEKTKTLSTFTHRLEDQTPHAGIIPMINLIGSTQQPKRRLAAYIDDRRTFLNADSGSHLDLMSPKYVKTHGYRIDRRSICRKRVRLADTTVAETIGRVSATLSMDDGSSYSKTFDVLPNLSSDVLLGELSLEEIRAFSVHQSSFVDVFAGERHLELSVVSYLGDVNKFLAYNLRLNRNLSKVQPSRKLISCFTPRGFSNSSVSSNSR